MVRQRGCAKLLENLLGLLEAFKAPLIFVKRWRVDAAARAAVFDGMLQMEHFVIQDILDGQAVHFGRIQQAAEDDGVVRGIVMLSLIHI